MTTKRLQVNQVIQVTVDEKKFDKKFLMKFWTNVYPLSTIDQHMENLAQLYATGRYGFDDPDVVVGGYGRVGDMGIKVIQVDLGVRSVGL